MPGRVRRYPCFYANVGADANWFLVTPPAVKVSRKITVYEPAATKLSLMKAHVVQTTFEPTFLRRFS
jgi:hypothetical protein